MVSICRFFVIIRIQWVVMTAKSENLLKISQEHQTIPSQNDGSWGIFEPRKREVELMDPLHNEIWSVLLSVSSEVGYVPDRERQKQVLKMMHWDTLVEDLQDHLATNAEEQKKFTRGKSTEVKSDNQREGEGKVLRGKVFETLLNADIAFGQRSALELELLALAHNPDQFGLGGLLGYYRNPDMAFILTKLGDSTVVEGIGEAKLGTLNRRAYMQLSDTGFARGVRALVAVVNSLDTPEAFGLVEVAKAKKLAGDAPILTIAPEFSQLLVVPANRNLSQPSKLINYSDFKNPTERKDLLNLLKDPKRVTIQKAAFSGTEVRAITDVLIAKI